MKAAELRDLGADELGARERDLTDQLFRTTPDGRVIAAADMMPVMMTTTVQQARRDCLFYTSAFFR